MTPYPVSTCLPQTIFAGKWLESIEKLGLIKSCPITGQNWSICLLISSRHNEVTEIEKRLADLEKAHLKGDK